MYATYGIIAVLNNVLLVFLCLLTFEAQCKHRPALLLAQHPPKTDRVIWRLLTPMRS